MNVRAPVLSWGRPACRGARSRRQERRQQPMAGRSAGTISLAAPACWGRRRNPPRSS